MIGGRCRLGVTWIRGIIGAAAIALVATSEACAFAQDEPSYDQLLATASEGRDVDYVQLRATFAQIESYNPYGVYLDKLQARALEAALKREDTLAVARAESLLAAAYPSMESQFWAAYVFDAVGDSVRADHHRDVLFRLFEAARSTGNGSSPESPITVLYTGEEYLILEGIMGLEFAGQALVHEEGHSFDRMNAYVPASGDTLHLFFNIDYLVATWESLFGR
jgi:hypothetical protein